MKPNETGKIRLKDLKQCQMPHFFFDTFINVDKYWANEEDESPSEQFNQFETSKMPDWDKYVADEYDFLVYGPTQDYEFE